MDKLNQKMNELDNAISDLKKQIQKAEINAKSNIKPLKAELAKIKEDKRAYASKNDFESVQACNRREANLKFKIRAQWNEYSILKDNLTKLNKQKSDLESQIKLKSDRIKKNMQILAQMDLVLYNYKKSQSLKQASVDSNIDYNHVQQWYEWGKNSFAETYSYFYEKITEIDECFKAQKVKRLKKQMDDVIEAYRLTKSLKEASKIANVSYDTVQYWYEWGSKGFGEENVYFFQKLDL